MGKAEDEAILRGMINLLCKEGKECLLIKAIVTTKRGRRIDRKFVLYRKGEFLRLVPDTIGILTAKETSPLPKKVWDREKFDPVGWIFEGELGGGRKGIVTRIEEKSIEDNEVKSILMKLPKDQRTAIAEE